MYLKYAGQLNRARTIYFRKIVAQLNLKADASVLDYGCGPGDFLLVAQSCGLRAFGVDNSERSIALACERGLRVSNTAASALVLEPIRYDAIIAQSVLEHVHDGVALVKQLRDLLKPGGVLVLSAPTPGPYFWDDPTHIRPYTPKSFEILAELAAFQCEYLGYVIGFLLGIELRSPLLFPVMNAVPASLGSNLVAFFRKPVSG